MNAPFIFMALSGVGDASMIAGFAAFGPKYMQNQFSMSAATAGIIFGEYCFEIRYLVPHFMHILLDIKQTMFCLLCTLNLTNIVRVNYRRAVLKI